MIRVLSLASVFKRKKKKKLGVGEHCCTGLCLSTRGIWHINPKEAKAGTKHSQPEFPTPPRSTVRVFHQSVRHCYMPEQHGKQQDLGQMPCFPVSSLGTQVPPVFHQERKSETGPRSTFPLGASARQAGRGRQSLG